MNECNIRSYEIIAITKMDDPGRERSPSDSRSVRLMIFELRKSAVVHFIFESPLITTLTRMTHLRKVMGFWDLVMFYIVTAFSIRWIATAAAAGPSSLVIWVIACVAFFIPLVYCVVEPCRRCIRPKGGLYVWTKRGLRRFCRIS